MQTLLEFWFGECLAAAAAGAALGHVATNEINEDGLKIGVVEAIIVNLNRSPCTTRTASRRRPAGGASSSRGCRRRGHRTQPIGPTTAAPRQHCPQLLPGVVELHGLQRRRRRVPPGGPRRRRRRLLPHAVEHRRGRPGPQQHGQPGEHLQLRGRPGGEAHRVRRHGGDDDRRRGPVRRREERVPVLAGLGVHGEHREGQRVLQQLELPVQRHGVTI